MGSISVNCQTILLYLVVLLLFVALEISCAISPDGEALVSLKTSIVSSDGIFLHWRQEDPDPCEWKGVTCDNHTKRVIYLTLGNHKLIGSIAPEIGKLDQLRLLALHGNSLYGSIPPELGNCTKLQKLYLQGNYMSGIIPSEIGNLLELEILDLSSNTLSGFIPSSLAKLTKLTSFNASMNFLTGTIPSEGILIKFTRKSFVGNRGLCGKQINVKCNNTVASTSKPGIYSGPVPSKKAASKVVVSTVATIFSLLLVALMCFWGCYLYKKYGKYDRTSLAVDVSGGT